MKVKPNTLLSLVVPLFNEESNVKSLYSQLCQVEKLLDPTQLEVIFVDDCSQDQTSILVKDICSQHSNVHLIRFAKNSGSHAAIMAGIAASKGNCVMFMAGDLQDPPKLIPKMLEKWQEGAKIVWAARTQIIGQKKKDGFFSSLYWQMVYYLTLLPIPKTGVDFFLIDRKVADVISLRQHSNVPIFQLVAETGFETDVVYYTKGTRVGGKSGWTLKKKLSLVLETVLFSPIALRVFALAGMILALAGVLVSLLSIVVCLTFGWGFNGLVVLAGIVSFLFGVQMTMLGLIGEYVFLALKEARKAPRFVISETVNNPTLERDTEKELRLEMTFSPGLTKTTLNNNAALD